MRLDTTLIQRHYVPDAELPAEAPEQSIAATLADLHESFALLGDWESRYQYIIDLGQALPQLPQEYCTEEHRLHGCQSMVWLVMNAPHDGHLYMHATSDAIIVRGLIALMRRVYSGRTPAEIANTSSAFIADLGLGDHLSPTRKNGLDAMASAIQIIAVYALQLKASA